MAADLVSSGAFSTGTTTAATAFGQPTTAHNHLVAQITAGGNATTITCSDPSWILAGIVAAGAVNNRIVTAIYYKPDCGANEVAPTFTATGGTGIRAHVAEYSGVSIFAPVVLDSVGTAGGAGSLTATEAAADGDAGDLLVIADGSFCFVAEPGNSSDTINVGLTALDAGNNDPTGTKTHYRFTAGIVQGSNHRNGENVPNSTTYTNDAPDLVVSAVVIASFRAARVDHLAARTWYQVEVAWGQATGGLFTFGTSRFGGTDRLAASAWSAAFNVPDADLTSISRRITYQRGRDNALSIMQGGSCTVDGIDPEGLLNDQNVGSPLAGAIYTGVPIRVSAFTSTGIKTPVYYGFIQTITSDPRGRKGNFQITAVDFFDKLQRKNPNLGPLTGQTDGTLFQAILADLLWTDPTMISLAVGDAIPGTYTHADGTSGALALIEEALTTERGMFFVAGAGAITYKSRYQILQAASQATIQKMMQAAPSALDGTQIVNRWTVYRTDMAGNPVGTPQVAAVDTSDQSYRRYGWIDNSITTPMLPSDTRALALAQFMVTLTKNPGGVGWQVPIIPTDAATLDQVIVRDLGDRVTLNVEPPAGWAPYTADYTIQQIIGTIDVQSPRHSVVWGVSEIPTANPFTIGVSKFGSSDYLAY